MKPTTRRRLSARRGVWPRKRIAILEWPYRAEEGGPPLAHRLSQARVFEIAAAAGLSSLRRIELSHMDFYTWDRETAHELH